MTANDHPINRKIASQLNTCSPEDYRHVLQYNKSVELSNSFRLSGRLEDLDNAIKHAQSFRKSLANSRFYELQRRIILNNLAADYLRRFRVQGSHEDLERAIRYSKRACRFSNDRGSIFRSFFICALALFAKSEQTGQKEVLESANRFLRDALRHIPTGDTKASAYFSDLGEGIYDWTKSPALTLALEPVDLNATIDYHRHALKRYPGEHRSRFHSMNNLAVDLHCIFQQRHTIADLTESISHLQNALGHQSRNPPRFLLLNNLAGVLLSRHRHTTATRCPAPISSPSDLTDAEKYYQEAVKICPPKYPNRPAVLCNFAVCLLELSNVDSTAPHSRKALTNAFNWFRKAVRCSDSSARARFDAALQWSSAAQTYRHFTAVEAALEAFRLRDKLLSTIGSNVQRQYDYLVDLPPSLTCDAVADALQRHESVRAVELLEVGRAILWSKLIDPGRTTCEDGRSVLASESDGNLTIVSPSNSLSSNVRSIAQASRHPLASVHESEHPLHLPSYTELREVGKCGPVIIVNISKLGSHAIVMYEVRPPTVIQLPEATPAKVRELASRLAELKDPKLKSSSRQRKELVGDILRDLWSSIVSLVVKELESLNIEEGSRIWWCPTSYLCALPLHAAGLYRKDGPKALPERYISSYTPTLSALLRARKGRTSGMSDTKLLVMGQTGILPEAEHEIKNIVEAAHRISVTTLSGNRATRENVLYQLPHHNWVHFACHVQLHEKPLLSSFQLANNEAIALQQLINVEPWQAEFAFLSACHTAAIGIQGAPDEVIHLAAALQFSGFQTVVGTLWAMGDTEAPDIAREFYTQIFSDSPKGETGDESARALYAALKSMRRRNIPFDRWVNFVHIGA